MTKAKELEILDQTIKKLGEDSYLAPWLTQVRFEVESMMRADYFPSLSLKDAEKQVLEMKQAAEEMAVRIIQQATDRATEMDKKREKYHNEHLARIYDALRKAERAINDI